MKFFWLFLLGSAFIVIVATVSWAFFLSPHTATPLQPSPTAIHSVTVMPTAGNAALTISSPHPGDHIATPFAIQGKARVFENQFNYRVLTEGGKILAEGTAMSDAKDTGEFGNYRVIIANISLPEGEKGTVEIFTYSAKDGSQTNIVSVPVQF